MWVEGDARATAQDLVLITSENSQFQQSVDGDLVGQQMDVVPEDVGAQGIDAGELHLQDNVVDGAGFGCEFAAYGECARLLARME